MRRKRSFAPSEFGVSRVSATPTQIPCSLIVDIALWRIGFIVCFFLFRSVVAPRNGGNGFVSHMINE